MINEICKEGLLVLLALAHGNQDIQKIIAFEGAFERLFGVIDNEGGSEGSIIVQDCINLINILINGNVSNQVLIFIALLLLSLFVLKNSGSPELL